MSAINVNYTPQEVALVSDTKVSGEQADSAINFCSKFHLLPSLQSVVASTGLLGFTLEWYEHLRKEYVTRDIKGLNEYAPWGLQQKWDAYPDERTDFMSTTIFHYGYSAEKERFLGYRYHSGYDFESEPLPEGMLFKPDVDELREGFDNPDETLQTLVDAISVQKRRSEEDSDVLPIGGEIELCVLTPEAIQIQTVGQFGDYEDELEHAIQKTK